MSSDSKIRAVAFDVDGTLVHSSWDRLHQRFGFTPEEDAALLKLWMEDALSFREWMGSIDKMYQRVESRPKRDEVEKLLLGFELKDGAREVVTALQKQYPIALISSGFREYVDVVAQTFSIAHAYAFVYMTYDADDAYSGIAFEGTGTELQAKVDALNDFGKKVGATPEEIVFVGDSKNDLAAFKHTGKGILVGESTEEMRNAAWKRIDALPEVLDILR